MGRITRLVASAIVVVIGALLTFGSTSAYAVVPDSINYQGILRTAGGSPVPDGSYSVTFKIYDGASGANPALWSETKNITTVAGLFTTLLGSVTALPPSVFSGPNRFLGITVSSDPEMTPRTPIVAVAYSYRIATVDGAAGGTISGDVTISSGDLDLDMSTGTTGDILKGGVPFIHNYGTDNTFIGINAGNLTMTGNHNTADGASALKRNTTGNFNTACGDSALYNNTTGERNTASGRWALLRNTAGGYNTAYGDIALYFNSIGYYNTACGFGALDENTTGGNNTASGINALNSNTTGSYNTAIGSDADVSTGALTNATAIGNGATVNASNKVRLGNASVSVIEGQVAYTFTSDKNQKENFRPVDGDEVLRKIRELGLSSWNYKGQDPQQFRHYGPMAQEFFAAFGHDGAGTSGSPTTINSGDEAGILMIALQALERKNDALEKRTEEIEGLKAQIVELREMIRAQGSKQK